METSSFIFDQFAQFQYWQMPKRPNKAVSDEEIDNKVAVQWEYQLYKTQLKHTTEQIRKRQERLSFLVDRLADHKLTNKSGIAKYRQHLYNTGDYVSVFSRRNSPQPMICRIVGFYQFPANIETIPVVELELCLQRDDFGAISEVQKVMSDRELFLTNRRVCQFVTTIQDKVQVVSQDMFMQIHSIKNSLYFTRAGFDCISKTFKPQIQHWKRICVCGVIPRPEPINETMVVCRQCQKIFHRKCVKCQEEVYVCRQCEGCEKMKMVKQEEIKVEQ